ncbi:MAG: UDP-glucose--hexose-1-phosphate uridylyltransferase [Chitinivibrionales bacterium]|nr:UDP-glucose--hexose-1-phosphate uridylyltransferase [Chitinivibrionales bacterium]MBD3356275.1 UDP-glucose--hexose-1-phosphate uridylyltransferase [Chitinivibrionales bacterium]
MNHSEHPHRRFNPLTGEWILVSPHRTKRPWQGQVEETDVAAMPQYDPQCYLCPGNERAGGERTPKYAHTFVFDNDFSALLPDTPVAESNDGGLLRTHTERGICRVICFSPRHDLTLALMENEAIARVIDVWVRQYEELGSLEDINYVQIFENRGAMMGCSNPHPHGQIWSNRTVPMLPATETCYQQAHFVNNDNCLLCDYVALEIERGERIVFENDSFIALVPFWAVWPFETMILPRRHIRSLPELNTDERTALADMMRRMGIRFDNLFRTSFPYSMGIHQKPTDGGKHEAWHLHLHYYPPLLRSASVRKFMVGYEMLGNPQRDITAEQAAARLRECSEQHYRAAS